MIDLLSVGVVNIHDVGLLYACFGVPGLDPRTLPGQLIRLDGREVIVTRVETYMVTDATRTDFGVVVREPPEAKALS